jgi:hypothetical protein
MIIQSSIQYMITPKHNRKWQLCYEKEAGKKKGLP